MIETNPNTRFIIPLGIIFSLTFLFSTNFQEGVALFITFSVLLALIYFLYYNFWSERIGALMVMIFGQAYFMKKMIPLLAAMIKVDGHVSKNELKKVKSFFRENYKPEKAKTFTAELDRFIKMDFSLKEHIIAIRYALPNAEKRQLIHTLVWIATLDRVLSIQEDLLLKYITVQLGIKLGVYLRTLSLFEFQFEKDYHEQSRQQTSSKNESSYNLIKKAYQALCIDSSASADEIKKAYRKLAKWYHPDRVFHQKEAAKAKFQTIATAYEMIKNERGIV